MERSAVKGVTPQLRHLAAAMPPDETKLRGSPYPICRLSPTWRFAARRENISFMSNRDLIDGWLRVHRQLMAQEADFTGLALKAAQGEISVEELDQARAQLLRRRALCNAVYVKAFPNASGGHSSAG